MSAITQAKQRIKPQRTELNDEQAPRKALYLLGDLPYHIDTQGPRLIITPAEKPSQPVPYNRINRIITNANSHWQGRALIACLTHNIPIIWLDRSNHPIGDSHPIYAQISNLHNNLENYLNLSNWQERYTNWKKHRRMDILKTAIKQHTLARHIDIETIKREFVYKDRLPSAHPPHIMAACLSIAHQHLSQEATKTRYWGDNNQILEIAKDLAQLLFHEYTLTQAQRPSETKDQISQFEHWHGQKPRRFASHLAELKRHLPTENETWH
jgi:hypothetical protein